VRFHNRRYSSATRPHRQWERRREKDERLDVERSRCEDIEEVVVGRPIPRNEFIVVRPTGGQVGPVARKIGQRTDVKPARLGKCDVRRRPEMDLAEVPDEITHVPARTCGDGDIEFTHPGRKGEELPFRSDRFDVPGWVSAVCSLERSLVGAGRCGRHVVSSSLRCGCGGVDLHPREHDEAMLGDGVQEIPRTRRPMVRSHPESHR
jgi:hypothetical protein